LYALYAAEQSAMTPALATDMQPDCSELGRFGQQLESCAQVYVPPPPLELLLPLPLPEPPPLLPPELLLEQVVPPELLPLPEHWLWHALHWAFCRADVHDEVIFDAHICSLQTLRVPPGQTQFR
jgi:hypothetical protein